jgi:hypothetical protein
MVQLPVGLTRKRGKKARIAAARRLLTVVYHVWDEKRLPWPRTNAGSDCFPVTLKFFFINHLTGEGLSRLKLLSLSMFICV